MARPQYPGSALLAAALMTVFCCHVSAAQTPAETYAYDAQGHLLSIQTRLGHTVTNTRDAHNRVIQQQLPVPAAGVARPTVNLGYNAQDVLVSVRDPRNLLTSYTVNGLSQAVQSASPETGKTSATFDDAGNLKTATDSRNVKATYSYDALDRITEIAYPGWTSNRYAYGTTGKATGRLTQFSDESGNTSFTYDGFGRLLTKTQVVISGQTQRSLAVKYTYGTSGPATGKVVTMTYPSGVRVNFSHDDAGRVAGLAINPTASTGTGTNPSVSTPVFFGVTYSATGAPTGWAWGNHTTQQPNRHERTYDLDGKVTGYTLGNYRRTLTYDDDGHLKALTSEGASAPPAQSFDYDGLGRLVRFDSGTKAYTYSYDASGKRLAATIGAASQTIKVDAASNRLASFSGPATKNYLFDAAGNQLNDGTTSFDYSPRGRPTTVRAGTLTYTQLFNALGERVFKSSTNTVFLHDETGQLIGEYDIATGKPRSETIYFGNQPVAVLRQAGSASAVTTHLFYIHSDHLHIPRMITSAEGNRIRWRWDAADPFGVVPPTEKIDSTGFAFNQRMPGQYYDRETNLFYNYQRDYDPQTGRYIQSDPTGLAGGLNTYLYAGANPVSMVDPTGEIPLLIPAIPYIASAITVAWRGYRLYQAANTIAKGASYLANASDCEPVDDEEAGTNSEGAKDGEKSGSKDGAKDPAKPGREKDVPDRGEPGEVKEGERRTREYGSDGKPLRDYDKPHQGYDRPHVHEWPGGQREHPGRDYSPWPKQ